MENKEACGSLSKNDSELLISNLNKAKALERQINLKWCTTAKFNWLREGDQNTKFFHKRTSIRTRRNYISFIRDNCGNPITDENNNRNHFINHYKNLLFHTDQNIHNRKEIEYNSEKAPKLALMRTPSFNLSVRNCWEKLFKILPMVRALSLMVLTGISTKEYWNLKPDFLCILSNMFNNLTLFETRNKTHIVFIPKIVNLERINEYRPISLYNVCYRSVSKILTNMLKGFLPELISPTNLLSLREETSMTTFLLPKSCSTLCIKPKVLIPSSSSKLYC